MTLEQQVREFYQEQRLSDAEVDAIVAAKPKRSRGRWAILAGATGVTAAAAAAVLLWFPASVPSPPTMTGVAGEPSVELPPLTPAVAAPAEAGAVLITVTPWAEAWVDGKKRGITPVRVEGLSPGVHEVVVKGERRTKKMKVVVRPGAEAKLVVNLEAGSASGSEPAAERIVVRPGDWPADREEATPTEEVFPDPEAMTDPEQLYRAGNDALRRFEYRATFAYLKRCIKVDKTFGLCYRAMGIAHARAGNGPEAYAWYKRYVEVAPHAKDADAVRQLLRAYESSR